MNIYVFLFLALIAFLSVRGAWTKVQDDIITDKMKAVLDMPTETPEQQRDFLKAIADSYYKSLGYIFIHFWIWDLERFRDPDLFFKVLEEAGLTREKLETRYDVEVIDAENS